MPALSTQAKEAIKTALAFVLVYAISLKMAWMNPYWSAFAVAMISLPTAGQSLYKGALRMGGTLLGCVAALAILGLAPQDRWLFLLLASGWIFFATYMMTGSQHAYFWHVSGFVFLIVTLAGPSSPENAFGHAVARTVETAMGVAVYTLVTMFIWPRSNAGAVSQAGRELLATQAQLLQFCRDRLRGQETDQEGKALRMQQVKQLGELKQALQAEGSESYQVHELRHQWARLASLSSALMASLDRWFVGFAELAHIDVPRVLPNIEEYISELNRRFGQVQRMLGGPAPEQSPQQISLQISSAPLRALSHFDRAAIALTRKELENLESLTRSLFACVQALTGDTAEVKRPGPLPTSAAPGRGLGLPVPDLDRLRGATFAAATTAAGFLIWILFDPPGHASMYQLAGTIAMAVALTPQLKATAFVKPFAVAMLLGLAIYVLVMPRLSGYAELAVPIFLFAFVTCYFFKGLGRLAGLVAMINMMSIQNQQTYSFAAMANAYIFTLMAFVLVFVVSFMIGSPRPEKAFLHLLSRFFRSAAFLMSRPNPRTGHRDSFGARWRTAFHRHELRSLPQNIKAWGRAIDGKKFPSNAADQLQNLVTRLQALTYRLEELLEAGDARQSLSLTRALGDDVRAWRRKSIGSAFADWSTEPGAAPAGDLGDRLATLLRMLEGHIDRTVERSDKEQFSEQDAENFYRLLGGYRGVSEAAVAYAGFAGQIDWTNWREERF